MLFEALLQRPFELAASPLPGAPLLTIALPTYNRARYLDRFFEHHLTSFGELGIDFEILVSDNCSTDATPEIIAKWVARDSRIRSVRQAENIGGYGNFLYCYRQSRGQFAIWVGDDDLLIADAVMGYLQRLQESPQLVMIQSPWIMIDETQGNAELGTFYRHAREELFRRGDHRKCLDFLLDHHVFPEWFILRMSACSHVVEVGTPHVYHYFAHVARALNVGDVLFAPEPFARVTAVSLGDNRHTGNSESMVAWDRYRGGLEFFASFIPGDDLPDATLLEARVTRFTLSRMQVAVRLHVGARNWSTAYQLERRLRTYGAPAFDDEMFQLVAGLAAVEIVVEEARAQACRLVVLDDMIAADTVEELRPELQSAIVRRRDPRAANAEPKAFALLRPPSEKLLGPNDILVDLAAAFRRHPT